MITQILLVGALFSLITPLISPLTVFAALVLSLLGTINIVQSSVLGLGLISTLFLLKSFRKKQISKYLFVSLLGTLLSLNLFFTSENWLIILISWQLITVFSYFLFMNKSKTAARTLFIFQNISNLFLLSGILLIHATTLSFEFGTIPMDAAIMIFIAAFIRASQFPFIWIKSLSKSKTALNILALPLLGIGPFLIHMFYTNFKVLLSFTHSLLLISSVFFCFRAFAQTNLKKSFSYVLGILLTFLFTVTNSTSFTNTFVSLSLMTAALFILVRTFASTFQYDTTIGLQRKSTSSYLFVVLSLGLITLLLKNTYIAYFNILSIFSISLILSKLHGELFSGGLKPKKDVTLVFSIILFLISFVFYSYEVGVKTFLLAVLIALTSIFLRHYNLLYKLSEMLDRHLSYGFMKLHYEDDLLELWGYKFGKIIHKSSGIIHKIFTGEVSKDIIYIAISIVALALGVMIC